MKQDHGRLIIILMTSNMAIFSDRKIGIEFYILSDYLKLI